MATKLPKVLQASNGRYYIIDPETGRAKFIARSLAMKVERRRKQGKSSLGERRSLADQLLAIADSSGAKKKKKKTTKSRRSNPKKSTRRTSSTGKVTLTKKAATDLHDLLYDLATGTKRSASVIDRHLMALKRKI